MLRHTEHAIEQGKIKEEDIDRALLNLFSVQLRLGLFDGDPIRGQFGKLGSKDVCSPEHKTLALEAARQGIVLLKNDKKFLPLNRDIGASLAVIGPMATTSKLGGGYSGIISYWNVVIFPSSFVFHLILLAVVFLVRLSLPCQNVCFIYHCLMYPGHPCLC